jgi:hypothetical protein
MPDDTGLNNMIAYKYMCNNYMDKAEKHFKLNKISNPTIANGHDSYGDFYRRKRIRKEQKLIS